MDCSLATSKVNFPYFLFTFHSIEIVQRAIILLKDQFKQQFIWNSLFASRDHRIISAYLMLLEDFSRNINDLIASIHFSCRHKLYTLSLIRMLGEKSSETF